MDRNEQTDADLVARSLAGDREAFVYELGRKQINGKEARGFVIEAKKIVAVGM